MMGLCQSEEQRLSDKRSKTIEASFAKEYKTQKLTQKLLLLGTAECGKSTILKQMRILHDNGFDRTEMECRIPIVYANVVSAMSSLIQAANDLGVVVYDPEFDAKASVVNKTMEETEDADTLSNDVYEALKYLWSNDSIQMCYNRRNEFQLIDCAKYFLDDLDRIAAADYFPTTQDILYTRVATTGVVQVVFNVSLGNKMMPFRVFDVGGQRSERRKWIHCFDNVHGIIFISAISEFNQKLKEDNNTNRLHESLMLFKGICNSKVFSDTCSMILFLNKIDLFAEKIETTTIHVIFPEYTGERTHDAQLTYIQKKFESTNETAKRTTYTHRTCATDTTQVQKVIDSVIDTVIRKNASNTGVA